jgi:hypothetical protein
MQQEARVQNTKFNSVFNKWHISCNKKSTSRSLCNPHKGDCKRDTTPFSYILDTVLERGADEWGTRFVVLPLLEDQGRHKPAIDDVLACRNDLGCQKGWHNKFEGHL